ncbi:DUF6881 domain-containing protein [Deinococcus sonorensis]|uniref:DUF6881 domain-containing protein n=1 Tax=Deinococcus sonorensis TaxID=309891 RepID=A0ABV8Y8H8_9DEIO
MSGALTYEVYDWHHEFEDQFVRLYSELDADRWELRKVEVFRDGRRRCVNSLWATGPTALADVQFSPLDEILSDPQFTGQAITQAEFE